MSNLIRNCHRCGKDFSAPYKECLCEDCLKVLGWESTPKTNADHIRSMTDEELAAWVAEFVELVLEANGMDDKYKLEKSFETNVLDKLKQPYKEES